MNKLRCLELAQRIDALLKPRLGLGVNGRRMLSDRLYARDVLLVCEAHEGTALPQLAHKFLAAQAESEPAVTTRRREPAPAAAIAVPASAFDAEGTGLPPPARSWASAARWLVRR